ESWSGLRRTPRASAVFEASARPGEPLLVDVAGRPVVVLAPLARVAPPSPGAADELFLFAGRGRLVSFPQGLELVDEGLHDWFRAHLLDVDEARGGTSAGRPPYRGLEAFAPADADRFVGREREVAWVKNRLRTTPLVAVVGPSGAGKSSFVQAGLVPSLPEGWSAITVRPGPRPLAALAARAGDDLLQRARGSGGTLVLVVDQLEELFTSCASEAEQLRFAQLLASATVDDPLRVVVTLRDDYLVRAESLPPLRGLLARGLELLTVPSPADLERILVEPARRAGYVFDDATLPGEMVRAVAGEPGALALLSFTALRLWELRDRQFKQLRRRSYEAMGS
ncbi:MAG TPA: hypothetical protein VMV01_15770, partial [Planctomycetota bacterium]|nr:hypothetical protein [Planctomycetota bacterium]